MGWPERWTLRKKLLCPDCQDVIADVKYRWWPPELTVRTPAGHEVVPRRSATIERELVAGRLTGVGDERALRQMLLAHHADLVYAFTCPRGHVTFRAAPQIVRAVRRAGGAWATLT